MRMAAPMIDAQPGASQAISEGLTWEPIGISRGAPTNGACPDVRLFLSIEQYLPEPHYRLAGGSSIGSWGRFLVLSGRYAKRSGHAH